MPLAELQTALGKLIALQASTKDLPSDTLGWLEGLNLTASERAWLHQMVGSPGFDVTCQIQRWWREMRLQSMARLTLAVLTPKQRAEVLDAYLKRKPCPSLFFVPEALGFFDFVIQAELKISHLEAVARFERALLIAAEAASWSSNQMSEQDEPPPTEQTLSHPAASIVEFNAPPASVLDALLCGRALPEPQKRVFPVLVAPWLPQLWHPINKKGKVKGKTHTSH